MNEVEFIIDLVARTVRMDRDKVIKRNFQKRPPDTEVYCRFFCLNYLLEQTDMRISHVAKELNINHATAINGLKASLHLFKRRDRKFIGMLSNVNNALINNKREIIKMDTGTISYSKSNLTKKEINSIIFMIENKIEIEQIAKHFNIRNGLVNFYYRKHLHLEK